MKNHRKYFCFFKQWLVKNLLILDYENHSLREPIISVVTPFRYFMKLRNKTESDVITLRLFRINNRFHTEFYIRINTLNIDAKARWSMMLKFVCIARFCVWAATLNGFRKALIISVCNKWRLHLSSIIFLKNTENHLERAFLL